MFEFVLFYQIYFLNYPLQFGMHPLTLSFGFLYKKALVVHFGQHGPIIEMKLLISSQFVVFTLRSIPGMGDLFHSLLFILLSMMHLGFLCFHYWGWQVT